MSIETVFDKDADSYDEERKQLIPCYNDFYNVSLQIIPYHKDRELRVLDLGAGTGIFSENITTRFPNAHLTLVDISSKMLAKAEERLSKTTSSGRHSYQQLDYAQNDLFGIYDLVISSLSIHHLNELEKLSLFTRIYSALEPGGMFINADQVYGPNELAQKCYQQMWLKEVQASGIPQERLQAAMLRMEEDRMSPLADQLDYLKRSGFTEITNWYQYYSFVVYSGSKPLTEQG